LQLTSEEDRWRLGPREAVVAQPGVEARWGVVVSGYLQKEEEEGELWRWPMWRLLVRTEMGRGRLSSVSTDRFIARVEDDAATSGGQVSDVA
jgi:hypothetical protein